MYILIRFSKYIRIYRSRILIGFISAGLIGASDAVLAFAIREIMDAFSDISSNLKQGAGIYVVIEEKVFQRSLYHFSINGYKQALVALFYFGAGILLLACFKGVFLYLKDIFMSSTANKILRNIRNDLYSRIMELPITFFEKEKTGQIISRVTNDVANLEFSINALVVIVQSFIYALIFVLCMFIYDWQLTLLAIIVFPTASIIIKYFGNKIRAISRRIAVKIADITAFLQETVAAITVVKAFTNEEFEKEKFFKKTDENYQMTMRSVKMIATLRPLNEFMSTMGMVFVIIFAGYKLLNSEMTIGVLAGYIALVTMAYKPIKNLGDSSNIIQKAIASAERIFYLIDEAKEPGLIDNLHDFKEIKGKVTFKDVYFQYKPGEEVLKGINIKVNPGKCVALVGHSGAGKTTILNLIARFYEIQKGCIAIDDKDIRNISLKSLRSQIGIVQQETVLFSGTIRDNILYGRMDASEDEIIEAAKNANAHGFIVNLLQGYNTEIGERGVQLSVGQKQRISIARAILKNPKILLLDEATSSLDSESEYLVHEALRRLMQDKTSFIIAHRLSTVLNADEILVVDKGRIVERGTHSELLMNKGVYRKLFEIQTFKSEGLSLQK